MARPRTSRPRRSDCRAGICPPSVGSGHFFHEPALSFTSQPCAPAWLAGYEFATEARRRTGIPCRTSFEATQCASKPKGPSWTKAPNSALLAWMRRLPSDICSAIGAAAVQLWRSFSMPSKALQLSLWPCFVLPSMRLPLLGTPSQLIVLDRNVKKPVSGFTVSESFRLFSRCFRTASPVVGLIEFTFRIHAVSMQLRHQRNATRRSV
ncbi:hypothetical protein J2R76_003592 [Bradyrhizobium sp. USDA 4532]|nr:hypothetical protein [Bradyrhizobium sp. USDA 4545]MCP1920001.1 hypothetical protein [Bradyrhizobium sp. USDA 4532]